MQDMNGTFYGALCFNSNLDWDTGNVLYTTKMFADTKMFNQKAIQMWHVQKVIDFCEMFSNAKGFQHELLICDIFFVNAGSGNSDTERMCTAGCSVDECVLM